MKIQRNQVSAMTQAKEDACFMFKTDAAQKVGEDHGLSSEEHDVMKDIAKDTEKNATAAGCYKNADFVLGHVV